jgi:hypothetical protein
MSGPPAQTALAVTARNGPKVTNVAPWRSDTTGAAGYMLEHPSIPHYERPFEARRDKVPGADNQQERPAVTRESSETARQPPPL